MAEANALVQLGTAILARRRALGVSQEAFADAIRMHRAQYGKIERGLTNVSILTLGKVAAGLETTVASLMADAGL